MPPRTNDSFHGTLSSDPHATSSGWRRQGGMTVPLPAVLGRQHVTSRPPFHAGGVCPAGAAAASKMARDRASRNPAIAAEGRGRRPGRGRGRGRTLFRRPRLRPRPLGLGGWRGAAVRGVAVAGEFAGASILAAVRRPTPPPVTPDMGISAIRRCQSAQREGLCGSVQRDSLPRGVR